MLQWQGGSNGLLCLGVLRIACKALMRISSCHQLHCPPQIKSLVMYGVGIKSLVMYGVGLANGHANGNPASLLRHSTSTMRPTSPFMEFSDLSQMFDHEPRSRRVTAGQAGVPAHGRGLSFTSTFDGSAQGGSR